MTDEIAGVVAGPRPDFAAVVTDELRSALADGDRALREQGDLRAGRQHFERAYQLAGQASDVHAMGLAALGGAGLWLGENRTVAGAAEREARLRHALSLLEGGSGLALRIRARLAAEADYSSGGHAAIRALLDQVRPDGDPVVLAEALSLAHHCLLGPDHLRLRGELADELIRVSFRTQRRGDLLTGLLWRTVDAYTAADPHAERRLSELREHLRPRGHLAIEFVVSAIDVLLTIRAGHLDRAEALTQACAEAGRTAGDVDCEWWPGAQLVTIRWYQGRLPELLPMLRDRVHSPSLSAVDDSARAALAVAAAQDGDRHTAASSLAGLCGGDLAGLARSSSWLVTMHGIVEAAYLLEDADVAGRAYDLLLPYAGLPMVGSLGVTCFGSTQHALGVASLAAGHPDRAVDHLGAAVRHNLALAHWPAVLASRQRLAQAHARRGRPGDTEAARRELDAAAAEAAPLRLPLAADPVARPESMVATCDRVGRQWRFTAAHRSVLVEDSIGMTHLAVLVASPRQEIRAVDLAAGLAALTSAVRDGGPAHPVLDREAVAGYRKRLGQLDAQLGRLEPGDESDRAVSARAERDWLTAELASAAGLGGRTRSFSDQGERARVAVGKAVRRAMARIGEADPVIGAHLRQAVRTGVRCSYWPGGPR
jgi:hypothetical protein